MCKQASGASSRMYVGRLQRSAATSMQVAGRMTHPHICLA